MFVRLGSAYHPHRAHLVRGVLEAHGIPVEVWHEESCHLYSPGWQPCSVMIPEEEVDAAIEVMNATPEELPEEGGADVPPPLLKYPTFLDWAVTGAALLLFFGIAVVLATMLEELGQSRYGGYYESGQLEPRDMLLYLVVVVPVGALAVAVLLKVFMAPLVIWDGDRWMGMIAYLWVRWILFVVVPIALAVAFGALRPEEG